MSAERIMKIIVKINFFIVQKLFNLKKLRHAVDVLYT